MAKIHRGKVFLIGAGPGDPGLLTLKGRRCLEGCDVVIYDALIDRRILNFAPASATQVDVGKRGQGSPMKGAHLRKQKDINRLLAAYARRGKTVARLKGGDPFLFGRGGEEAEFLAGQGVPFEVVPGVSSLTAVPAYAGIPVTDRRYNSMLTVVTGHPGEDLDAEPRVDWKRISPTGTLVVLMGMGRLQLIVGELLKRGWPPRLPVACVRWGTTENQRVVAGTLRDIARKVDAARPKFDAPAVIVIGEVVRLRKRIGWFDPGPFRKPW